MGSRASAAFHVEQGRRTRGGPVRAAILGQGRHRSPALSLDTPASRPTACRCSRIVPRGTATRPRTRHVPLPRRSCARIRRLRGDPPTIKPAAVIRAHAPRPPAPSASRGVPAPLATSRRPSSGRSSALPTSGAPSHPSPAAVRHARSGSGPGLEIVPAPPRDAPPLGATSLEDRVPRSRRWPDRDPAVTRWDRGAKRHVPRIAVVSTAPPCLHPQFPRVIHRCCGWRPAIGGAPLRDPRGASVGRQGYYHSSCRRHFARSRVRKGRPVVEVGVTATARVDPPMGRRRPPVRGQRGHTGDASDDRGRVAATDGSDTRPVRRAR
ncbi:MAG: hypothetical protein RLZZ272_168 [Actinomycetota bacterium]